MKRVTMAMHSCSASRGFVRFPVLLALGSTVAALATQECGTPTTGDTACYLGPSRDYSVCYSLTPLSDPPPSGYDYNESCATSYGETYALPQALLDLYTTDENDYVAPNFQLGELAQEYKGQYAIIQSHAVTSLQSVRDAVGALIVNSGYRSPAYNASVEGASCSRHMYGDAFDLVPSSVSLSTLASTCYSKGAGYVEVYDSFVHCDWRYDSLDEDYYREVDPAMLDDDLPVLSARLNQEGDTFSAPASGWTEGEPLREWTALGPAGLVLQEATGPTFRPPAGTTLIRVRIGAVISLNQPLE